MSLFQTMTLQLFSLSLTAAWAVVGPLIVSERVSHLGQMPGHTTQPAEDLWEFIQPALTQRYLQPKGKTLPSSQVPPPIYYGPELWRSVRSISGSCMFRFYSFCFVCLPIWRQMRPEVFHLVSLVVSACWFSPVVAGFWTGTEGDSTECGPVAALHQLPHHRVQQRGGCRCQAEEVSAGSLWLAL